MAEAVVNRQTELEIFISQIDAENCQYVVPILKGK